MKIPVGIDFTETFCRNLKARGFHYDELPGRADVYRRFQFPLADSQNAAAGFEIHVVGDETRYLQEFRLENFIPFIIDGNEFSTTPHENSAFKMAGVVGLQDVEDLELRQYFELRKPFSICALRLECRDYQRFYRLARPDIIFRRPSRTWSVIHLGPNCFDLLTVEAN